MSRKIYDSPCFVEVLVTTLQTNKHSVVTSFFRQHLIEDAARLEEGDSMFRTVKGLRHLINKGSSQNFSRSYLEDVPFPYSLGVQLDRD